MWAEHVPQSVRAALPLLSDDLDHLRRRPLRGLPVRQQLGHRQIEPALEAAPGHEDIRVRLPRPHRFDRGVLVLPLAAPEDQDAARVRMDLAEVGAKLTASARCGVTDEDSSNRAASLGMGSESARGGRGVDMGLDLVMPAKPLAQIPLEETANRGVVVDDRKNRGPGRIPIVPLQIPTSPHPTTAQGSTVTPQTAERSVRRSRTDRAWGYNTAQV